MGFLHYVLENQGVYMVIGIIEDDKIIKKSIDTSLKNQGYTTILASFEKEAIKKYR